MSFKSPEHSTPTELVSAVGSLQEGSLYWENFISIKQLHGNSRTAQGDPPAKLPSCLSLFLGTSEWRGYPVSHLSERRERDSQYLSINWLALRQQNQPDLNLKSPLSLSLSLWSEEWQHRAEQVSWKVPTIIRLSLIRWSYNRFTSIIINGQKKDKSNL